MTFSEYQALNIYGLDAVSVIGCEVFFVFNIDYDIYLHKYYLFSLRKSIYIGIILNFTRIQLSRKIEAVIKYIYFSLFSHPMPIHTLHRSHSSQSNFLAKIQNKQKFHLPHFT